jgi:phage-related protein
MRQVRAVRPGRHARCVARTQAVFYRDWRGAEPVDDFIEALPPKGAAKIDEFIEEHLNGRPPQDPPPPFPVTSQIDGELRELRVRFADTRYRILYQRSENLVVLLHAIEKDTGAVPRAEVDLAPPVASASPDSVARKARRSRPRSGPLTARGYQDG